MELFRAFNGQKILMKAAKKMDKEVHGSEKLCCNAV